MPPNDAVLIVVSGAERYAVRRGQVLALSRAATTSMSALAARLGGTPLPDERYAITIGGVSSETVLRCERVDLRGALPQLALPAWLAQLAHPAVVGVVLDDGELVPLVDLAQLAFETGYTAA